MFFPSARSQLRTRPKEGSPKAGQVREWMATYAQAEDLINIGAYAKGTNLKIDQAVHVADRITAFLRQPIEDRAPFADTLAAMHGIIRSGEAFSSA